MSAIASSLQAEVPTNYDILTRYVTTYPAQVNTSADHPVFLLNAVDNAYCEALGDGHGPRSIDYRGPTNSRLVLEPLIYVVGLQGLTLDMTQVDADFMTDLASSLPFIETLTVHHAALLQPNIIPLLRGLNSLTLADSLAPESAPPMPTVAQPQNSQSQFLAAMLQGNKVQDFTFGTDGGDGASLGEIDLGIFQDLYNAQVTTQPIASFIVDPIPKGQSTEQTAVTYQLKNTVKLFGLQAQGDGTCKSLPLQSVVDWLPSRLQIDFAKDLDLPNSACCQEAKARCEHLLQHAPSSPQLQALCSAIQCRNAIAPR